MRFLDSVSETHRNSARNDASWLGFWATNKNHHNVIPVEVMKFVDNRQLAET